MSEDAGDGRLYTTGDMARLSHNTMRTVRFYEEMGVLMPASRSDGGHRLFSSAELDKLLFVTDMRGSGLSLEQIRILLAMKWKSTSGKDAAQHVAVALGEQIRVLDAKIGELTRLREELVLAASRLDGCSACEHDTNFPDDCSLCDKMKDHGPIPRAIRVLWRVRDTEKPP